MVYGLTRKFGYHDSAAVLDDLQKNRR